MYSARFLGAANFGVLSYAMAFTSIFAVLGDLGLQTLIVREVARYKETAPKYLANVNLMKLLLISSTFLVIVVVINVMGYPQQSVHVVYILWIAAVVQIFSGVYYSIFQGNERMEFVAIGQIANSIITLASIFCAIYFNFNVITFACIYIFSNSLTLIYCIVISLTNFARDFYKYGVFRYDKTFWKPTIQQALPFGLQSLFVMLYYYTDTIILSLTGSDNSVGLYNAAYKLSLIPLFINAAFNSTLIPLMARFSISSPELLGITFKRYFKYMMLIGIPIGIGTTLLSSRFVLLIFGPGFTEATTALQILIWSTVFIFLNGAYIPLVYALNKQGLATRITLAAALFNIISNIIIIPAFGFIGASYVKSATELLVLILTYLFSFKFGYMLSLKTVGKDLVKIILASSLMGAFIWYFNDLNLLILVPAATLIYFVASFLFLYYDKHDVDSVRQIMGLFRKNKTADN
jgi:O-antigen/teichoic acid export membrane protein